MKFIRPTTVTEAMLTSSTVPETDHAEWAAATTYAIGDRVIRLTTHKIYECLVAGVNATTPEVSAVAASPRWIVVSPTNKWAMFDKQVGTATTATTSMTVVLAPGRINSLALLEVQASTVDIALTVAGEGTVYSASMNLTDGNSVGDWYQYFYEPVYQQDALVITDLVDAALLDMPAYSEGVLTITLTGDTVSVGVLVVGLYADLGETQYSPTIGITDYSRKEIDTWGNPTLERRKYAKRMSTSIVVLRRNIDQVTRVLSQYRSTELVWVGAGSLFTCMIIYGFYKDWDMSIDNYSFAELDLQVEGMV